MYNSRPEWERQIRAKVEALYAKGGWRDILGGDFVMEPADAVVVQELDVRTEQGRFRLAATKPTARPPFEWLFEITSEINTGTAMRHYLLREEDIVLAERRTLTPIDEAEAQVILDDLALVEATLAE
jgi:hypothetical protein